VVAAMLLAFLTAYIMLAKRFRIVDKPTERSSHSKQVVTGGGIVFFAAISLYFFFHNNFTLYYFAGLSLLAIVSYADDIKAISVYPRFVIQIIAATMLLSQIEIDLNMNFDMLPGFHWTYSVATIVVMVGIFNLFNFMDGINGMLGVTGLVLFVSLLAINYCVPNLNFIDSDYLVYVILSLGVFLFYNLRKQARCFAGDVGAITFAFIAVYAVSILMMRSGNYGYIFLFAPYAIEAGYTIVQRIYLRHNIFKPHRIHLFQLLCNELHYSHSKISIIYGIGQLLLNAVIVTVNMMGVRLRWQLLIIGGIYSLLSLLYIYWKWKIMSERVMSDEIRATSKESETCTCNS
jgi:UDP-N-acetylmuramyl pentapeptide phosphotransferase/UDP-N-acetylglucosamine-1-phosphate transferase